MNKIINIAILISLTLFSVLGKTTNLSEIHYMVNDESDVRSLYGCTLNEFSTDNHHHTTWYDIDCPGIIPEPILINHDRNISNKTVIVINNQMTFVCKSDIQRIRGTGEFYIFMDCIDRIFKNSFEIYETR